jgi:hypothetical protein
MALEIGQTPESVFPGLTRRYPIRLMGENRQLVTGRTYRCVVSMGVGNPAFHANMRVLNHFDGLLYDPDSSNKAVADAWEAIYIHVLDEIA